MNQELTPEDFSFIQGALAHSLSAYVGLVGVSPEVTVQSAALRTQATLRVVKKLSLLQAPSAPFTAALSATNEASGALAAAKAKGEYWVIQQPGGQGKVEVPSFEECMSKWFEGFNIPVRHFKDASGQWQVEDFAISNKRVKDHMDTPFPPRNSKGA